MLTVLFLLSSVSGDPNGTVDQALIHCLSVAWVQLTEGRDENGVLSRVELCWPILLSTSTCTLSVQTPPVSAKSCRNPSLSLSVFVEQLAGNDRKIHEVSMSPTSEAQWSGSQHQHVSSLSDVSRCLISDKRIWLRIRDPASSKRRLSVSSLRVVVLFRQ